MTNSIVKLYFAYVNIDGVKVQEQEFVETPKQFRRNNETGWVVTKDRNGEPDRGYARTPDGAIEWLRLYLERKIGRLRRELEDANRNLGFVQYYQENNK